MITVPRFLFGGSCEFTLSLISLRGLLRSSVVLKWCPLATTLNLARDKERPLSLAFYGLSSCSRAPFYQHRALPNRYLGDDESEGFTRFDGHT